MKKTPTNHPLEVLILGRHRATMDRTLKALSKLPIRIDGAITDDQAFDFLSRHRYDVISNIQVIVVPRPDAESFDRLSKKPIQMDGPDELIGILSGILKDRGKK